VLGVNRGRVSMLEICPDAMWDETPSEHRLNEITGVNFGGDYEDALHLVGGRPVGLLFQAVVSCRRVSIFESRSRATARASSCPYGANKLAIL
jgi:hypothetical protein